MSDTRVGYWSYWFKSPDGIDITFSTNKNGIPKGYKYIKSFRIENPDGRTDEELSDENGKILFYMKNTHKLSKCEKINMAHKLQYLQHKYLNVEFIEKLDRQLLSKQYGCKIRRIKE